MSSPGKCYFKNHLQPKHDCVAAKRFLKMWVQTSNYKNMHIDVRIHPCMLHTLWYMSSGMQNTDDLWLVINTLCKKID